MSGMGSSKDVCLDRTQISMVLSAYISNRRTVVTELTQGEQGQIVQTVLLQKAEWNNGKELNFQRIAWIKIEICSQDTTAISLI